MKNLPTNSEMYAALLRRDASFDGVFYVAVKTTAIFCRPTCTARKPRRENVEFFPEARDAMHAGYRPCKVCRPMDAHGAPPVWIRRIVDRVEASPLQRVTEGDLRDSGIDPGRIRRYFKQHYGMTFHAYQRARRMGMALAEVRAGADVTAVGLRHGFESTSGFRDAFTRVFGRPPGRTADIACLFARWFDTPLGAMLGVAGENGVCLLEFVDRRALERELKDIRARFGAAIIPGRNEHLDVLEKDLAAYFRGSLQAFNFEIDARGTPFQQRVWRELRQIPYGETTSYTEIARRIGRPQACRAVGRANGDNRLAIVIPCHRVVRADGSLCGYGGGLWRKRWLLDLERGNALVQQESRDDALIAV